MHQVDQSTLVLPRAMLADPLTYSKLLNSYAEWMAHCAHEIARANRQRVPMSSLIVDAHETVEFEIELSQVRNFIITAD